MAIHLSPFLSRDCRPRELVDCYAICRLAIESEFRVVRIPQNPLLLVHITNFISSLTKKQRRIRTVMPIDDFIIFESGWPSLLFKCAVCYHCVSAKKLGIDVDHVLDHGMSDLRYTVSFMQIMLATLTDICMHVM